MQQAMKVDTFMDKSGVKLEPEYPTNEGDTAVVLEYVSYECVWVTFKDTNTPSGFRLKCQLGDLRRGRVKNPYKRQYFNVGYKGVGNYVMAVNGKNTKTYHVWRNMLSRSYNAKNTSYKDYGERGVTVCEEWHNFQNFAEWYESNYVHGFEIDKDLINPAAKQYSSEYCTMLPAEINKFLGSSKAPNFWFDQNRGRFVVQGKDDDGKNFRVGRYKNKDDALIAYIEYKKGRMKHFIQKHGDGLSTTTVQLLKTFPERVYESYSTSR